MCSGWTDRSFSKRQTGLHTTRANEGSEITGELRRRALFREVNARIRAVSERFGRETRSYQILCECGTDGCLQRVEVPVTLFAEVHEDDERFLVAPGHERPLTDRLVHSAAGYSVVAIDASRAEHARNGALTPSALGAGAQ